MSNLADKIEREGPSRELDAEIFAAIGAPLPKSAFGLDIKLQPDPNSASGFVMPLGDTQVRYECPHYTSSLDAAMTLVPNGWRCGFEQANRFDKDTGRLEAWVWPFESAFEPDWQLGQDSMRGASWETHGYASTPALALCAAALRARSKDDE